MNSSVQTRLPSGMGINIWRVSGLVLGIAASIAAAWFLPCYIGEMKTLVSTATTIFSILSGFSLTIIGIVGGLGTGLASFSWQQLQSYKDTYSARLWRQVLLCLCHVIALILAMVLVGLESESGTTLYIWIGRAFVFSACLGLCAALVAPFSLVNLYAERYELLLHEKGAPPIN